MRRFRTLDWAIAAGLAQGMAIDAECECDYVHCSIATALGFRYRPELLRQELVIPAHMTRRWRKSDSNTRSAKAATAALAA